MDECALTFETGRAKRLLVLPALFDEANKLRRFTAEVMRRCDLSGIDCILPDLPGCNESLQPLKYQTLPHWREATSAAIAHFEPTHILTIRAGALLDPGTLPGWRLAKTGGKQTLRAMLRARTIAAKEAGLEESTAGLQRMGRDSGIELAGWHLGPAMFGELEDAAPRETTRLTDIALADLGGVGALWLRAEPDEDPEQADALAAIVAIGMSS